MNPKVAVRVTAVNAALKLAEGKVTSIAIVLNDAEKIEKYLLGYETKPEGE